MKVMILGGVGTVGGYLAYLIGGWDSAMATLVIFMIIDYLSGLAVAGIFKNSPKTEHGALNSHIGFKGLVKKAMILMIVLVANRIDMVLGMTFCRDAAIIALITNELISIVENAGCMGIPVPRPIKRAIEMLYEYNEIKGGEKP